MIACTLGTAIAHFFMRPRTITQQRKVTTTWQTLQTIEKQTSYKRQQTPFNKNQPFSQTTISKSISPCFVKISFPPLGWYTFEAERSQ